DALPISPNGFELNAPTPGVGARSIQSGSYFSRSDRGRPFYAESWTEDWGSMPVSVSWSAKFTDASVGGSFAPDRRPSVQIALHNGNRSNVRGLTDAWYGQGRESLDEISGYTDEDRVIWGGNGIPDAFDYLISRLDQHYDAGFRRIVLHLPAGSQAGDDYDSAQYWTMEDWRRKWFWLEVRRWIAQKELDGDPVSMGVFLGWKIHEPWRSGMDGAELPDMNNIRHVAWMHQNIYPWIRLGFTEFWFDASSRTEDAGGGVKSREVLASLRHSPTWGPLARFGGEAIPGDGRLIDHTPAESVIGEAGWMGIPLFIETRFGDLIDGASGATLFDPDTTEVTCWIKDSNRTGTDGESGLWLEGYPISFYERLRDLGMVFRVHTGRMDLKAEYAAFHEAQFLQRLLSFGRITAPLDFDSDGQIELTRGNGVPYAGEDWDLYFEATMRSMRGPGGSTGYFAGDLTNDGIVDYGDLTLYRELAETYLSGTRDGSSHIVPLDLGDPWWVAPGTLAGVHEE
ncbi:MAG: hypothetical protein ACF8Q5_11310, partial [Phycisphaerales bacterium JB040]